MAAEEGSGGGEAVLAESSGEASAESSAGSPSLDELATFVVAVNQSLAVLSRAGTPDSELRSVARLACSTVANALTPS
ncbi:hypothetical protein [Streptomyces sp. SudanB182_2057]|uniref:hypothetical protein n=1 Tax=Streptomyces sp. SudanB182_2057 TaxID=3035281 RepID=UPI003F56788E